MENVSGATSSSPPVLSVDGEPAKGGARTPVLWGREDLTSSTTDSSRGPSLVVAQVHNDDIGGICFPSHINTAARFPDPAAAAAAAAATAITTTTILGAAPNRTPSTSNRAGQNGTGGESSQAPTSSEGLGLGDINDVTECKDTGGVGLGIADEIRNTPRCSKTEVASRARIGRAYRTATEASKADTRGRFWNGVKPSRASSTPNVLVGAHVPFFGVIKAALELKKRAHAIQAKSAMNQYVLDPRSARMLSWKNWMFVNIMFTVLVTPWRISFNYPASGVGLILAGIANISFVVDTVLHFFTAVMTESGVVTERKKIARRYLTSWFVLDLLTCPPYTTLLRNVIPAIVMMLAPLRGLRLLRLHKVVKVYTLHYEVSPVALSIGKTLLTVVLAAHLLGCFWFWVHCYDALQQGEPKVWAECGTPTSRSSQYLSSFYFIIYTMMTVGYGDQHADHADNKAMILTVFIQLTGATLFGFIIAATRRIVQYIAPIQKVTNTNLQKISDYALDRRLPDGISSRIKRHFRYFYFKTSAFDETAVMEHVPWNLRQEVMAKTHRVALAATGLLQDREFSPLALMQLARAMKPMELNSREEVILEGDVVLQAYFVIKGRIEAYVHATPREHRTLSVGGNTDTPALRHACYLGVWGPGSMWGLSNIMLGGASEAMFVAASPSDLLWLDQSDLIEAIEDHSDIRACLDETATSEHNTLQEALRSPTITMEGLNLKQISLTDFKASDLKQQLKHTDIHNLCMAARADQLAAASASQAAPVSPGRMVGMVQDIHQLAVFGGRGLSGTVKSFVSSVKKILRGRRGQTRLTRTWRRGSYGPGEVLDDRGKVVKGVMETDETTEELYYRLIILPDHPIKLRWDVGISMLCVLVAVLTPYRMAFAHNDAKSWLIFDAAMDVFFVVDILLRLRTAYVGNATNHVIVYVTVPGMIVKNYFRGWMLFDIASTVPGYLFGASDRVFRSLVVLKLLRIGRVPALGEQLHRLREQQAFGNGGANGRSWLRGMNVDLPRWCLDVAQILVVVLYASHVLGCFWWVMSRYNVDRSWWQRDGLDLNDATSTYIASLYWAATTITTVGYGDIVPTNDLERVMACMTMVGGTTMFSYVIGSVSTLVMNPTGGNVRRKYELMNVENYLEEQKVGAHLGDSVRKHMMFVTAMRSAWNEDHILSRLPPRLQERVLEHVHRDAVLIIPILKTRPPSFAAAVLRNLQPRQFSQGETVYKSHQSSQGVYFITKGIAVVYVTVKSGEGGEEEKTMGIVPTGKFFGYNNFLVSFLEEEMAVKASTQLYVYLLSNCSIRYILRYHPYLAEDLRISLEEAMFQQASEEISAENKKVAAPQALLGRGASNPDYCPGSDGGSQYRLLTPALSSYLRRASLSAPARFDAGEVARIQAQIAGEGRKREARDNPWGGEGEVSGGTEEKMAGEVGEDVAPRLGCGKSGKHGGQSLSESAEQKSQTSPPPPCDVLVTQLTWSAGAWDDVLLDAAPARAAPATASIPPAPATLAAGRGGVAGTVRTTPDALANEIEETDYTYVDEDEGDDGKSEKGTPAETTAVSEGEKGPGLEPDAVQVKVPKQGIGEEGDGGGRRLNFTARIAPVPQSSAYAQSPSLEQEDNARHVPPAAAWPEDRNKSREFRSTSHRENEDVGNRP